MPDERIEIERVLALLAQTTPRLGALSTGLAPDALRASSGADEWSATDVLAHLRACADVWGTSIATIIREDTLTLRAISPVTWIRSTDYPELEFRPSLVSFAEQRAALLALLEPLPPKGWARSAIVTGAGRALERTVLHYALRLADHERQHVKQIERILEPKRT